MGEMALWADMISSSQLTLGIVFGPAVWANFERFLPYPFHFASGRAWFPAARGQTIGKKEKPGAHSSPGLNIYFLSPFLDLKSYREQEET